MTCITGSKARKGAQRDMSDSAKALVSRVLTRALRRLELTAAAQKAAGTGVAKAPVDRQKTRAPQP